MSQQSDMHSRLQQLRARRTSGGASNLVGGVFTPLRGGFDRRMTIQPVVYGEEIAFIKDATSLCLGRIGTSGNICLKPTSECDTDSHTKKKGEIPEGKSLILLKGGDKGYESVVLEADELDQTLIDDLLHRENVSWPSEFAKMKSNDTKTLIQKEVVEDVLNTTRKHRSFASPAKFKATENILDKIGLLDTSHSLVSDMLELAVNEEGEGIDKDFTFEEVTYVKTCRDLYDRVEVLAENSKCLNDVILDLHPFILSHTKPVEHLLTGMRTEMASFQGQLGNKDLYRKDIPPCLWNAVETGYDTVTNLDKRLTDLNLLATEAHEIAEALLDEDEQNFKLNVDDEDISIKKEKMNASSKSASTRMLDGKIIRPKPSRNRGGGGGKRSGGGEGGSRNGDGFWTRVNGGLGEEPDSDESNDGTGNPDCDKDAVLCGHCMSRFDEVDNQLMATNIRLSNLEDSKNGNVDSAIMVKNKIYRGRADVAAELDMWFPSIAGRKIDAGLFPTPHLILNLMHADICSKKAPKIPLDQKDLIKLEIRRSDADAFYALQSDKPEFMITHELCPNFTYKASKAQRDAAAIRFLPSHEDFGNGLDSDSLHFKFKSSLEHAQGGERKVYRITP